MDAGGGYGLGGQERQVRVPVMAKVKRVRVCSRTDVRVWRYTGAGVRVEAVLGCVTVGGGGGETQEHCCSLGIWDVGGHWPQGLCDRAEMGGGTMRVGGREE